jgi:hypothetical protein
MHHVAHSVVSEYEFEKEIGLKSAKRKDKNGTCGSANWKVSLWSHLFEVVILLSYQLVGHGHHEDGDERQPLPGRTG